jgi:hypothetical protein
MLSLATQQRQAAGERHDLTLPAIHQDSIATSISLTQQLAN